MSGERTISKIFTLCVLLCLMTASGTESEVEVESKKETNVIRASKSLSGKAPSNKIVEVLKELELKYEMEEREEEASENPVPKLSEPELEVQTLLRWDWFNKHNHHILDSILMIVGMVLLTMVIYKSYSINQKIKSQNNQIQDYAQQLEQIIDGADKLVFVTWKDHKEGIKFADNPCYKKKTEASLSAAQQIQEEMEKIEADIKRRAADIEKARNKELFYLEEIASLEKELEEAKTRVFDEGAALGYAETVLKEFK